MPSVILGRSLTMENANSVTALTPGQKAALTRAQNQGRTPRPASPAKAERAAGLGLALIVTESDDKLSIAFQATKRGQETSQFDLPEQESMLSAGGHHGMVQRRQACRLHGDPRQRLGYGSTARPRSARPHQAGEGNPAQCGGKRRPGQLCGSGFHTRAPYAGQAKSASSRATARAKPSSAARQPYWPLQAR